MEIILASSSPYRRLLLERLQLEFRCQPAEVDEQPHSGEDPQSLATRLALAKAHRVAEQNPTDLVIGSDQVAAVDGRILGKPGNHCTAVEQLRASSGRMVCFHTALALVVAARGVERVHLEPFSVYFRVLNESSIEDYLQREQPYDCAGSFRWEGLGIALFQRMEGRDPTSLEGLPLIALCGLLDELGYPVLNRPPG